MWPFRKKNVVHVDVKENVPTLEHPETRVATYELGGQAQNPFYFEPKSFRYNNRIAVHVRARLPPTFSEKAKKRTLVKVWRDDNTRDSPALEKVVASFIWVVLSAELVAVAALIIAGSLLPQETVEEYFPGAALAAVAANAAFFLGNLLVRASKAGASFEYTKKQQVFTNGLLLGAILLNVAALSQFPAFLLPPDLTQLADKVQRAVGTAGLVATIVGAGISGAFDTFKWVIIEEVQRKSEAARQGVDLLELRERI